MKLEITLTAESLAEKELGGKNVVVIDVFRATSTILAGLACGCEAVIPVLSVEEARVHARRLLAAGKEVLIAGERKGLRIPGLDLGNSPVEFCRGDLKGKTVVLTTSNGTRVFRSSAGSKGVLVGALVNSKFVAETLLASGEGVVLACSGRLGEFSLEDFLGAGAITHFLAGAEDLEIPDLLLAAKGLFEAAKEDLPGFLKQGKHGRYLEKMGFSADIDFCLRLNTIPLVPRFNGESIII